MGADLLNFGEAAVAAFGPSSGTTTCAEFKILAAKVSKMGISAKRGEEHQECRV